MNLTQKLKPALFSLALLLSAGAGAQQAVQYSGCEAGASDIYHPQF